MSADPSRLSGETGPGAPLLAVVLDCSMLDRTARDRTIDTIEAFLADEIDSWAYDERLDEIEFSTDDATVHEVRRLLWYHYCDFRRHRCEFTREEWQYHQRLVLLLRSDWRYELDSRGGGFPEPAGAHPDDDRRLFPFERFAQLRAVRTSDPDFERRPWRAPRPESWNVRAWFPVLRHAVVDRVADVFFRSLVAATGVLAGLTAVVLAANAIAQWRFIALSVLLPLGVGLVWCMYRGETTPARRRPRPVMRPPAPEPTTTVT